MRRSAACDPLDLRERVLAAVAEGAAQRQAAKRFGVSPTSTIRRDGRAPRGERCRVTAPFGYWRPTTLIAARRTGGPIATALLAGSTNSERFRTDVVETPACRH